MKYDLSIILMDELHKIYGLTRESISISKLYQYMYIRCSIYIDNKTVTHHDLINCILEELNIDIFQDSNTIQPYILYKDVRYTLQEVGEEIISDLEFRADLEGGVDLKSTMDKVYQKGYKKSNKYRRLKDFKTHVKYNRLLVLNELFGITPLASDGVEGFNTKDNHNPFKRSLEQILEANLKASQLDSTRTTTYITEKQLEDYLIDNLDLIEEGLVFVGRQIEISDGIIDILAKDKEGILCIIELKINEDKSIVWQTMYYPEEIKNKYNQDKVRIMTIVPHYSKQIIKVLQKVENIEMFKYNIKTSKNNIDELIITKVN